MLESEREARRQTEAAKMNGWLDERATAMGILTPIKRADADALVACFTNQVADSLRETS